jgi:hypothetical protein
VYHSAAQRLAGQQQQLSFIPICKGGYVSKLGLHCYEGAAPSLMMHKLKVLLGWS